MATRDMTPGLGLAARKGFIWQAAAFLVARISMLASTVVLARVLGPADFGLVSLGLAIVLTLNVIADLGASQALVYLPRSPRRTDAALGMSLAGSLFLALVWVLVAPTIATGLGDPEAGPTLQVLALVIVFTSLGQVPDAMLRKELQFSRRLPGELTRGLLRGLVAVGLALAGFGAWSLVIAEVLGALGYALVSWTMLRARPGPVRGWVDRIELRALTHFGIRAAMNGALATVVVNVDYVIVASMLGTTALGVYLVGFRIPELLILSVFQVFSQVTYPVYTKINDDAERLRRALLLSLRVQATYGMAVAAAIAVTAPIVVPLVFGAPYQEAVPVMQAIACYAVCISLAVSAVDIFKSVGRPELGIWMGVARLLVLTPGLLLATRWGIVGVAVAQALVALLFAVAYQQVVSRVLGLRMFELLKALLRPALTAACTGIGAYAGAALVGEPTWWAVVVAGAAAALAGGTALLIADRPLLRKVVER